VAIVAKNIPRAYTVWAMSAPIEPKLGRILHIALPIVVSNASYTAMLFIDRLFLSRVGKHELAAAMSGGMTAFVVMSFFIGLIGYAAALVAQYYGAGRHEMCTRATTQALYLALASYPLVLACIPLVDDFFALTGQDPELTAPATVYGETLLWGGIFVSVRTALSSFFVGLGRTRIVMAAHVTGTLVTVPLNYALIFGHFGVPALGIWGAALGTIGGSASSCLLLGVFYLAEIRGAFKVQRPLRFAPDIARRLLRFGLPAGAEPCLNWCAFNIFVQVMHAYGADTAAAATIAFNFDTIAFVPLMGLGAAATTVVGQHLGARDPAGAMRSTALILRMGWLYALAMMALFLAGADLLVRIFASGFADPDGEIADMAAAMLRLLTLYTLANASKLILGGSLRAAGDTRWLMGVSVALHWAMAIGVYLLAHVVAVDPYVAWFTLIVMNNGQVLAAWYRYRSGVWQAIRLID